MKRNKTEKKHTQTHNNKPPVLQCGVPSSDNCNGNENTKPADISYILCLYTIFDTSYYEIRNFCFDSYFSSSHRL